MDRGKPDLSDARALAWEVLQRVESGGYADALLGHLLASTTLARRDQALAVRLVYGTLAWQQYLDHILSAFSQKPIAKLDVPIRCVLRLALLQICKLDRIPPFAAVDTAVNLSKRYRNGSASGFVNAVLRRAARGWTAVPLPQDDSDCHLSVRLSHPQWLVTHWLRRLGEAETSSLMAANNEAAPTTVRVNQRRARVDEVQARLADAGVRVSRCEFSPLGLILEDCGKVEDLPGYADGHFTPQGEASQLIGMLAAPRPGSVVLDACAAPGGKTTHLAEAMDNEGRVIALDIHPTGIESVRRSARRLGLGMIEAQQASASEWTSREPVDLALVDAPCSGLGTLRQHPEIKWRRQPSDVAELARLQKVILEQVASLVRPQGVLVYSTCTISAPENEEQVDAFLATHDEFVIEDPRSHLPAAAAALCDKAHMLRTYPHRHGLDGFFAVRLRRRN